MTCKRSQRWCFDPRSRHVGDVLRQRHDRYGNVGTSFGQIAQRWSMVLGVTVTAEQVALCLMEVKMARLAQSPRDLDGRTDIAGYAACLDAVMRR